MRTRAGLGVDRSCEECLRRCWFLGRLGPYIQKACDHAPGRRVPELLALATEDLVKALAPGKADVLLGALDRFDASTFTAAVIGADCWAICRHDHEFPRGLTELGDSPHCLLIRGEPDLVLDPLGPERFVTIVGARRATPYGLAMARSIAGEAAAVGLGVISGMALGIDGAAHRGALDNGRSLAVLGSGAGRPYPASHRELFERLSVRGAVVTEFPPGVPPWRWSFPARNRIMAGLSRLTVVVEAATGSGSLITAEMAADAGREVGAVPGPVTSPQSAGSNELIASGAAVIRDGRDLIESFAGFDLASDPNQTGNLTPTEIGLIEAIGGRALALDSIAGNTGLAVGEVLEALNSLEMDGYVAVGPTGDYSLTPLAGRLVRRMLADQT